MSAGTRCAVLAAALWLVAGASAAAFPDGAPWEATGTEGCARCHFDAAPVEGSEALSIEGLPAAAAPGAAYRLTIRLAADVPRAGFLASALRDGAPAGAFAAHDGRAEASGAQVRSTLAGSDVPEAGEVAWTVEWTAPETAGGPVTIEVWANAADDDGSPFGDRTHRRRWTLPIAADP